MIIETWMIWVYAFWAICTFMVEIMSDEARKRHIIVAVVGASMISLVWPLLIGIKIVSFIRSL